MLLCTFFLFCIHMVTFHTHNVLHLVCTGSVICRCVCERERERKREREHARERESAWLCVVGECKILPGVYWLVMSRCGFVCVCLCVCVCVCLSVCGGCSCGPVCVYVGEREGVSVSV